MEHHIVEADNPSGPNQDQTELGTCANGGEYSGMLWYISPFNTKNMYTKGLTHPLTAPSVMRLQVHIVICRTSIGR